MKSPIRRMAEFGVHCLIAIALLVESISAKRSARKNAGMAQNDLIFLRSARLIYVYSPFELSESLIEELRKRPEFQKLGFVITRNISGPDLTLYVHHHLLPDLYTYNVVDERTHLRVVGGKVTSFTCSVTKKVAKRVMKEMVRVRAGLS